MSEAPSSDSGSHGAFLAVLAALLVAPGLLAHGSWAVAAFEEWSYGVELFELLAGVGNVLIVATLGVGAVMLLLRRPAGRWMVVTGAVGGIVALVVLIVSLLVLLVGTEDGSTEGFLKMGLPFVCVGLLGPSFTLMCTLAASTGEWLRRGRRGVSDGTEHRRA
ncbi:hypothetical protein [Haloactinomyces albus]|uniref:Uncharacterized protein n=1 Tax=Haloactinomyces albus TaxID=1352928 RepID=A0AAE3ZIN0_9ACTN|nr:hypothetical protein [Haloactinomyces albus]MDR7304636.1 hypothetical protein [Haloactinomyces albus]